jgi:hypothetical protein
MNKTISRILTEENVQRFVDMNLGMESVVARQNKNHCTTAECLVHKISAMRDNRTYNAWQSLVLSGAFCVYKTQCVPPKK